jgi:hypothetical protein
LNNNINNNKCEDVFFDIRNFSAHVQSMKTAPSKVASTNQLLSKAAAFYGGGRRGSLPVEYICMSYMR